MDTTTLFGKFKSTLHEMADSKKAVKSIGTILTGIITFALGLAATYIGQKIQVPDAITSQIPMYSAMLAAAIIAAGMNYVNGQAKVDVATLQSIAAAPGTPEFKDALKGLGAEAIKAAITAAQAPEAFKVIDGMSYDSAGRLVTFNGDGTVAVRYDASDPAALRLLELNKKPQTLKGA